MPDFGLQALLPTLEKAFKLKKSLPGQTESSTVIAASRLPKAFGPPYSSDMANLACETLAVARFDGEAGGKPFVVYIVTQP